MSRVLPKEPRAQVILTATCKWTALAGAMKHYFDETVTGEQFQQADVDARNPKDPEQDAIWWEEDVHAPYTVDAQGDVWACGGWIMAMPMPLKNIWIVYQL